MTTFGISLTYRDKAPDRGYKAAISDSDTGHCRGGEYWIEGGSSRRQAYGTKVLCFSPHRKLDLEFSTGAEQVSLDRLLRESDIVSLHTNKTPETEHLINRERISLLKNGAILVNASFADAIDPHALYDEVNKGEISVALDVQYKGEGLPDFSKVSSQYLIQMGIQAGYNTAETVKIASGLATRSMINLLTTGKDEGYS